eukprot:Gb_31751 [translate_table: standard]
MFMFPVDQLEGAQVKLRELQTEITPRSEEFQSGLSESGTYTTVDQLMEQEEILTEKDRESYLCVPSDAGSLVTFPQMTEEKKTTMEEISREWFRPKGEGPVEIPSTTIRADTPTPIPVPPPPTLGELYWLYRRHDPRI